MNDVARDQPLPQWDLSALYDGRDDPRIEADFAALEREAEAFALRYQGRIATLDGDGLAAAIAAYEGIDERLDRIGSFAQLVHAGDQTNGEIGRFMQGARERTTAISSKLLFFTLEIQRLEEAALETLLASSNKLAHYRPWLRDIRVFRDHRLSDELEKLLHEKQVAGSLAWIRLFDETLAALRFPVAGEELTVTDALNRLTDQEPDRRRDAALSIGEVLKANTRLFAHITNTLAKDKAIEDGWRKYAKPWSSRNLANQVEDEVVEALAGAVQAAYPSLSHRYYALKARWFGVDQLNYWDRNAPLPMVDERKVGWDEARDIVLDAYGRFSGDMAALGRRFFEGNWIDAQLRPGKYSGAFSHSTVPSAHPFILMNFHGKIDDVMTLAHELGHGVHQLLAAPRGQLMAQTPLTLAETASVFGEMLTFRALLGATTDPVQRKALLAGKVEDMLNTVVRQIAFFEFERRLHTARREKGEQGPEQIAAIWMGVQSESLGPAFKLDELYESWWSYIPHFIHSPFYVYAYAFGDCLVNSLYAVYQDADRGFAQRYLEMLSAGGTKRHKELLAPFGLDASAPGFWDKGLGVIRGLIDELEAME